MILISLPIDDQRYGVYIPSTYEINSYRTKEMDFMDQKQYMDCMREILLQKEEFLKWYPEIYNVLHTKSYVYQDEQINNWLRENEYSYFVYEWDDKQRMLFKLKWM